MTVMTFIFNMSKKRGEIKKIGKCRFITGTREFERTLYEDITTGDRYVIYNKEAYLFKPYKTQPEDAYLIGRI